MPSAAIITAVLPGAHDWLRDLAQSVRTTRDRHPELGLKWLVVWDGPCDHSDADLHVQAAGAIVLAQTEHRGVAAARNRALFSTHLDDVAFIAPMDADDLLAPAGLASAIADLASSGYDWAAANRTLLLGDRTPHWHARRTWSRGEVADTWSSPLAFHPNSLIVATELARQVGGWPEIPANEDLLFAMLCNEVAEGISVPHVLTRYRVWDRQVVNQGSYPAQKAAAHRRDPELSPGRYRHENHGTRAREGAGDHCDRDPAARAMDDGYRVAIRHRARGPVSGRRPDHCDPPGP